MNIEEPKVQIKDKKIKSDFKRFNRDNPLFIENTRFTQNMNKVIQKSPTESEYDCDSIILTFRPLNQRLDSQLVAAKINHPKDIQKDCGLDKVHAASIRDSANKLREKMRVHAFQKHQALQNIDSVHMNKQTVQHTYIDKTSVRPQNNRTAQNMVYEVSPKVEKELNNLKSVVSNDEHQNDQITINSEEYSSKLTFSGERNNKSDKIRTLEEKLQQTEKIVLNLQK